MHLLGQKVRGACISVSLTVYRPETQLQQNKIEKVSALVLITITYVYFVYLCMTQPAKKLLDESNLKTIVIVKLLKIVLTVYIF